MPPLSGIMKVTLGLREKHSVVPPLLTCPGLSPFVGRMTNKQTGKATVSDAGLLLCYMLRLTGPMNQPGQDLVRYIQYSILT
jgi:hypothetical protein